MKDLIICEHQTSKHAIIFSPLHEQSFRAAVMLQSAFYKITGASLPILSDTDTEPSPYEIIVGLTNRENVTFPYDRRGIRDLGHSISVKDDLLILNGGSFHGATFAVDAFVKKFLHYDAQNPYQTAPHIDLLTVPANYYFENSPRSWVANLPAPTSKGANIYMISSTHLPNGNSAFRGMGYIIQSANGKLLVIDSGQATEAPMIVDLLKKLSGKDVPEVEGWFMTHTHSDHIEGFLHIAEKMPDAVKVKTFYHHMPSQDYAARWNEEGHYLRLRALENSFCPFHEVQRGDVLEFDEIKVDVIFTVTDEYESYLNQRIQSSITSINAPGGDATNNADTLYKFTADGHSALFIGDFMNYGEDFLYQYHPEILPLLKADFIQMGHHGSNFLSQKFYSHVNARVALWNTTLDRWLFSDPMVSSIRRRIYQLRNVKNHVAGYGIYPIPFDMSDITDEDRQYYTAELNEISFSDGKLDSLLLSRQYDYTLYLDEKTAISVNALPFDTEAKLSFSLNGTHVDANMTVATNDVIEITVSAKGQERHYRFFVSPFPTRRKVLHLDMKTHRDGVLCDLSGRENSAVCGKKTTFVVEDGRPCFRPTIDGCLTVSGADLAFGKGDFTLSVWVKPYALDKLSTICYYGADDCVHTPRYYLRLQPTMPKNLKAEVGAPIFSITSELDRFGANVYASHVLKENEWAQITVVHENLNQKLYINGQFSCERSYGIAFDVIGKNELMIGCHATLGALFFGAIGEFCMYNYAMNDEEIATHYKENQ